MDQAHNLSGERVADSRHLPLDRKSVLDKCLVWVTWMNSNKKLPTRDVKRIHEAFNLLANNADQKSYTSFLRQAQAFNLLANNADQKSYTSFLRQAQAFGGKELVAILALAVGKAAFRDMRQHLKRTIPGIVAEQGWHQSDQVSKLVHSLEHPAAEKDDASIVANEEVATRSAPMEHGILPIEAQDPMHLQQLASFASESLYTAELAGNVYELDPTDILEVATMLVTKKLECPGQLLMTEPFLPVAQPFVFIPITAQLCFYFRELRQRVM
ncbi:hypothetical protein DV735_g753, partial [Chaetothyriales sp. CBS 134920]